MDGFCVLAESIPQTRIGLTTSRLNMVVLYVQRAWAPTPQGPKRISFPGLQKCSDSDVTSGNTVSQDRSAASAHRMKAPARGIRVVDTGCANSCPQHRLRSSKPLTQYLNLTARTFKFSRPRSERAGFTKIPAGRDKLYEYDRSPKNRERRKAKKENTVASIS